MQDITKTVLGTGTAQGAIDAAVNLATLHAARVKRVNDAYAAGRALRAAQTAPDSINSIIDRVAKATGAPEAGVVISTETNGRDSFFVIWAIGTDRRITSERLDVSCTGEARLQAHVEGFVANHRAAWAKFTSN